MPIVTLQQQQAIKPISQNWANTIKSIGGVSNYDQLAIEVEETELQQLIGVELLQDIQDNSTSVDPKYTTLLNGGTFENCNGNTVKFKGLRYVLAYMNYSQIVTESFVADTFTGFVKKDRNDATALSSAERKEIKINVRNKALVQWDLCKQFLSKNSVDYPFWNCTRTRSIYNPTLRGYRTTVKK